MATTSIRWAVIEAAQTLIRAHATVTDDTVVQLMYAGDEAGPDAVWIDADSITGQVEIAVFQTGRKQRDDEFEYAYLIRCQGYPTADAALDQATAFMAAIADVYANDPSLGGVDGLIAAEVSEEMGPAPFNFVGGAFVAYGRMGISAHSRLS